LLVTAGTSRDLETKKGPLAGLAVLSARRLNSAG
jgi:hypothetical protein